VLGFGELESGSQEIITIGEFGGLKNLCRNTKSLYPDLCRSMVFSPFPELNSVKKYALEVDWDINSEVMKSHQRSSIGNVTIDEYMQRDYKKPKNFSKCFYM